MSARGVAAAALAAATLALLAAGCGGGQGGGDRPSLTVSAAASLQQAFDRYGSDFRPATVHAQFAGSDELAAQIRQGVRPDVFAAANTALPQALYDEGLVEKPVVFAGNRLVLAVPADGRIRSLGDAARAGVTLAVGAPGVPVGDYTQKVLARLPAAERKALLDNVRTREPDVKGVVGKLLHGAVDAGFVYVTDVRAAGAKLRAVALPDRLQPTVAYAAAVVKGSAHVATARAFLAGLLHGPGRTALRDAGFEPPPHAR